MSKYKCTSCGANAHYIDFFKQEGDQTPNTVYAYCVECGKEAWGGVRFHPKMNELFNEFFSANMEYLADNQEGYARRMILQTEQ